MARNGALLPSITPAAWAVSGPQSSSPRSCGRSIHCPTRSLPAVLLEIGYHDNYSDATWLEGHWDAIAQQIARGLTEYFGLPFIYPMDPMQGTVSVSNGTLNLRDYPSSSGKVIANLPNGAAVTIYGEWNGWYVVHYGDQVGYAAAAYINT